LEIESHAQGASPVCELLDWSGPAPPPRPNELMTRPIRQGALPPEALLRALASAYHEAGASPLAAMGRMLVDAGILDSYDPNELGVDPRRVGIVTETLERLRRGELGATSRIHALAQRQNPKLLAPVTQFSIRREQKKTELPARRVKRLNHKLPPAQPTGDWLVVRWHELDEALANVFAVNRS
jgi:hypothetical protein